MDEFQTEVMEAPQQESRRNSLMVFVVVVVVLLACAVAGLGAVLLMGRGSHDAAQQVSPLTIPATTLEQSSAPAQPPGRDTGEGNDTETSPEVPPEPAAEEPAISDEPAAPCNASALVATVGGSIDGHPVNVTDFSCTSSGDHAWALLTPTEAGLDPLYVYFRDVGGGWETLDYGTSISCTGAGIPAGECAQLP